MLALATLLRIGVTTLALDQRPGLHALLPLAPAVLWTAVALLLAGLLRARTAALRA